MQLTINPRKMNPNGFYLLHYMQDETLRFIVLYGGSSSAKSYSVAQCVLLMTIADGENTLVMRKVGASISKTIYEDFKQAAQGLGIAQHFTFVQNCVRCDNGAKIDFSGLDDPEKIKGISNYKRISLEEWSEFEEQDFKQLRKRLRGKRGQQIIATFNPIKETHWIKTRFFDVEKWHDVPMEIVIGGRKAKKELCQVKSLRMNEGKDIMNPRTGEFEHKAPDTVLIQSTYLNNFWVVGSPDGTYGFYDEQCVADFEHDRIHDPDYYNVYALGEWGVLRTGSEYLWAFQRGKHCSSVSYDPSLPLHVSVDNNVLPYISISVWQYDASMRQIRQLHDIPAETPNNTVRKASALCKDYIVSLMADGSERRVYFHGDASGRAANTIDEQNRSFLDLFIEGMKSDSYEVIDCVAKQNPSVAMSGEFVNAIFEDPAAMGLSIVIGEDCRTSIEDYQAVQKDVNGAILKTKVKNKTTGQSYEEHGHLTDTFRYVVCDIWRDEFITFSQKRKRNVYARGGDLRMFNPNSSYTYTERFAYLVPSINSRTAFVELSCIDGNTFHVTSAFCSEEIGAEAIYEMIPSLASGDTIWVECDKSFYFMCRELRERFPQYDVRIKKPDADVDMKIKATSDFVRLHVQFSSELIANDERYAAFVDSMMDYRKDAEDKSASIAVSGVVSQAIRIIS